MTSVPMVMVFALQQCGRQCPVGYARADDGLCHAGGIENFTGDGGGTDRTWKQLAAGWFHSCARTGGVLRCWGRNTEGQLGVGDDQPRTMPTQIGAFRDWEAITTGQLHTCGARLGALFCWGDNTLGQLSPGLGMRRTTPTMITIP